MLQLITGPIFSSATQIKIDWPIISFRLIVAWWRRGKWETSYGWRLMDELTQWMDGWMDGWAELPHSAFLIQIMIWFWFFKDIFLGGVAVCLRPFPPVQRRRKHLDSGGYSPVSWSIFDVEIFRILQPLEISVFIRIVWSASRDEIPALVIAICCWWREMAPHEVSWSNSNFAGFNDERRRSYTRLMDFSSHTWKLIKKKKFKLIWNYEINI